MLYHHGDQTYAQAASDAARHARGIMETKIEEGRASALSLFEHANTVVPVDSIVRARALAFDTEAYEVEVPGQRGGAPSKEARARLLVALGDERRRIHRHALSQMAEKAGVPGAYLSDLAIDAAPWQADLAAHVLDRHFRQGQPSQRFLARSVKDELRGFLSDRYRRLDSRPLLDAFAQACQGIGAVPVEGVVTDTRMSLKAFLPMVFEPVPNEVMCLGIDWSNSDYGNGKHAVRAMIWRLWCTNKATCEDALAQVHLGGRLGDDIEYSQATYELDTRTSVSALNDTVKGLLGPDKVNTLLETIKAANEKQIDWRNLRSSLEKKLLKGEMKAVEDAFKSEDVINLPAGKTAWRASNAISWIAGKAEDAERRLELERIAGELATGKRDVAKAAA